MPFGYFIIEQWKKPKWAPVLYLDSYQSLTKVVRHLARRGKPGLFRILQMQRCICAEVEGGKLRVHGSHASSEKNLRQMARVFEREGGRQPVEKARQQRLAAKRARQR